MKDEDLGMEWNSKAEEEISNHVLTKRLVLAALRETT